MSGQDRFGAVELTTPWATRLEEAGRLQHSFRGAAEFPSENIGCTLVTELSCIQAENSFNKSL